MAFTFIVTLFFSSRHSGIGLVGSPVLVNPMARWVSLYYLELSFSFFLTTAHAFRAFILVFSRTQVRFTTFSFQIFIHCYYLRCCLTGSITIYFCRSSSVLLADDNPLNLYKMLHCPLVEENWMFLPITTCCSLRIPIWWNWIIFQGTPDDFSWHTSVGLHSGLEMLCYNSHLWTDSG